jgi:hypothetical protein
MNERKELEALRRMAALEAKQRGGELTETIAEATKRQDTNPAYGMSGGERALAGAGKFFSDIGQGVGQIVGAVPQEAVDERARLDAPLMNTGTGRAGYMGAGAISGVPTLAIPGANTMTGAALLGAVMGGAAPVPTGDSRMKNMALGAAGGAAAQGVGNLVGRLNQPVQSKLPPELADLAAKAEGMGIPLDAADKTGSRPLKIIRSVFESLPGTADKQAALNEAKRAAFNRATLNEVGENATKATPDVLNSARTRIGGEFDRLTQSNQIAMGNDFLDAIVKVDGARNEFTSPAVSTAVDKALALLTRAEKQGGKISGADYQKIRSTLGKAANDAYAAKNSELGGALKTIKRALDQEARNSLPAGEKEAWDQASRQWQNLKIVEKAAAPTTADAVAGNVSPAKLAQALQSVDKQGYTYGTRGDNMSDLARVGQAFVKDQIPNSGTAERTFWTRFMENPLNAVWQGGAGGISRPLQSLMNSPAGQRYFTAGVIPDSEKRRLTAELLKRGLVGGTIALPISEAQK